MVLWNLHCQNEREYLHKSSKYQCSGKPTSPLLSSHFMAYLIPERVACGCALSKVEHAGAVRCARRESISVDNTETHARNYILGHSFSLSLTAYDKLAYPMAGEQSCATVPSVVVTLSLLMSTKECLKSTGPVTSSVAVSISFLAC